MKKHAKISSIFDIFFAKDTNIKNILNEGEEDGKLFRTIYRT